MSNSTIPATRNEAWGFWGTMGGHASIAWPLVMHAIARPQRRIVANEQQHRLLQPFQVVAART